jgi:hypothetical protein
MSDAAGTEATAETGPDDGSAATPLASSGA